MPDQITPSGPFTRTHANTSPTPVNGQAGTPPTCTAWNDRHDCGLPDGHPGDHACGGWDSWRDPAGPTGCGDVWNRDEATDAEDARGEWDHERPAPAERCIHAAEVTR